MGSAGGGGDEPSTLNKKPVARKFLREGSGKVRKKDDPHDGGKKGGGEECAARS